MRELDKYVGIPKCPDCRWKLGTDITDNCSCMGELTPERAAKHKAAFEDARRLQEIEMFKQRDNNQ
jgi:hypothetical protein